MQTALFVAILLVVVSVPLLMPFVPVDAATLQLVTENGNVFSIDFDEILGIYQQLNPTSTSTQFNSTIQQLVNSAITNSTSQQEIDELEMQIEDLITQLNATDTSLLDTINKLQMQLDALNSTAANSNSTLTELSGDIQSILNEFLQTQTASVGIDALGNSGSLTTVWSDGLLVYGTHTDYSTSGTVIAPIPYLYHNYDFGWATLIQHSDSYDKYEIPTLAEEYTANTVLNRLEVETDTTDAIHIIDVNRMGGENQYESTPSGLEITGTDPMLLEVNKRRLGIGEIDFMLQGGATAQIVRSPNDLANARYFEGKFAVAEKGSRTTSSLIEIGQATIRAPNNLNSFFDVRSCWDGNGGVLRCSYDVFGRVSRAEPTPINAWTSIHPNSAWQDSNVSMREAYGNCHYESYAPPIHGSFQVCGDVDYRTHSVDNPDVTYRWDSTQGLYHTIDIKQEETVSGSFYRTPFTGPVAAKGTWIIADPTPYVVLKTVSTSSAASFDIPNDRLYILAKPNNGSVTIAGNVIQTHAPELLVSGLEPNTAWTVNTADGALYHAGITNNAGEVIIPRTPKDSITTTRTANFSSSPDIFIPDRGTHYDTVSVNDTGTVNDAHVIVESQGTDYNIQLVAPSGSIYQPIGRHTTDGHTKTYSFENTVGEQINGDWTLEYKATSGSPVFREWTLVINHGNSGKVNSVTGSGSQYLVEVGQAHSGTYGLDIMDANGIRDAPGYPYDHTTTPDFNEIYVAGGTPPPTSGPLHVHSIERHNPTAVHAPTDSLEYLVTFNNDVEGVDAMDFSHAYSSRPPISVTQDTDLEVWFGESIIDVINIRTHSQRSITPNLPLIGGGEVTSTTNTYTTGAVDTVEIDVDITNEWVNDVTMELVAPDGTSVELCRGDCDIDGDTGDQRITATYNSTNTPSLADLRGTDLRGIWTLRVGDTQTDADNGTLNNWKLRIDYGTLATTYLEHAPATSRLYLNPYMITNATLILNVTSIDNRNVDEWDITLTSPGSNGATMVISDASQTPLDRAGGLHEFHLGEMVGIDPPSGSWILSAVDNTHDHDPSNDPANTAEREGIIDFWTLEIEHASPYGTIGTVVSKSFYDSRDEFDLGTGNNNPTGITSHNNRVWVVDDDDTVYAYDADGTHYSTDNFGLAPGNDHPSGITSSYNGLWVLDQADDRVYAYESDGTYSSTDNFNLATGNDHPYGITSYNNKFWVVDNSDDIVYAYDADGTYSNTDNFNLATGNDHPHGITFYNNKFWVVDNSDDIIYRYDADGTYSGQDNIPLSTNNGVAHGITSHNNGLWAVDSSSDKMYTYDPGAYDIDTNQFVVPVSASSRQPFYNLWLRGDNDITANGGSETFDTRETLFAPDPHEHYNRGYVTSQSSWPYVKTISVNSHTHDTVTFDVIFSESVTGVNATDFIAVHDGVYDSSRQEDSSHTGYPATRVASTTGATVSDTISVYVGGDNTADALTLNVDITHNRIGDLEVELVSPDGTVKKVHDNAGGNGIDLKSSFNISTFRLSVNGDWILQVRDNGATKSSGTINSWSLDFEYDGIATYEELIEFSEINGDFATWKHVPTGTYYLQVYGDALVNEYCNGILFDGHNQVAGCFPYSGPPDLIFIANTYLKQTISVDVSIRDIRLADNLECRNAIYFDIDDMFEPGDSLYIPILPNTNTLCMKINGVDVITPIQNRIQSAAVMSMPAIRAVGSGASSTTGASTFATVDGTMTVTAEVFANAGAFIDHSFDFTPRYQVAGLYQDILYTAAFNGWENRLNGLELPSSAYIMTFNVYVNGILVDTDEQCVIWYGTRCSSLPQSSDISTTDYRPFLGTQTGTYSYEPKSFDYRTSFQVQKGDFVQVEAVLKLNSLVTVPLPPETISERGYYCSEWHGYYIRPGAYVGSLPSDCSTGYEFGPILVNPVAEVMINSNSYVWKEAKGHVIFSGQ